MARVREVREVYGPLAASWEVRWSDSSGSSVYPTAECARGSIAALLRNGRASDGARLTVTRIEHCPVPGCNGDGTRSVRKRGAMFATGTACVGCRGAHEVLEDPAEFTPATTFGGVAVADLTLHMVLACLGLEHAELEYGRRSVRLASTGWEVFRGSAGAVWLWLRETGRIL